MTDFTNEIKFLDTHDVDLLTFSTNVAGTTFVKNSSKVLEFLKNKVSPSNIILKLIMNSIPVSEKEPESSNSPILYRPKYIHAEDYGMWSELIKLTEFHNLQDILLKYRWHGGNVSCVHENRQIQTAKEIQSEMLEFLTDIKEVENELLSLLRNSTKENSMEDDLKDNIKIKRPKNPFLKNLE